MSYIINKNSPLVTVVVRCYNQADFIEQAIYSVCEQTYTNLEILIIDDHSQDSSRALIEKAAATDDRIKVIFNEKNVGKVFGNARTLNICLEETHGKYFANLDGDDFWLSKEKIAKQVEFLEHNPEYVLVGTFVQNIDKTGRRLERFSLPTSNDSIRKKILVHNQISASSILLRTETLKQVGGYPEDTKRATDLGLWLRLGYEGKFHNIPKYWHAHRMTGFNIGETQRQYQLQDALYYIQKHRDYYPNFAKAYIAHILSITVYSLPHWVISIIRRLKSNFKSI